MDRPPGIKVAPAQRDNLMNRFFKIGALAVFATTLSASTALSQDNRPASKPYTWKNVQMVGGGFVDGIVCHPTAKGVRYARTDIGGAYRWRETQQRWEPMLDWVSYEDINLMGVESIALDPSDPNRVYLACGTYTRSTPNAILRSADQGRTFQRTDVPFAMGGNEDGRGNGERMAVDPHDGRILFMGTRLNGMWTSEDYGATWTQVTSFPDVTERQQPNARPQPTGRRGAGFGQPSRSSGVIFVIFDPTSGSAGRRCSTLYAGASLMNQDNLFVSKDAGKTWQPVAGHPQQYRPTHAALSADGSLYITYGTSPGPSQMTDGGVWKYDTASGAWTDITPDKPGDGRAFGYAAVSVDAQHPKTLIVSSFCRPDGDEVFRSIDGGRTWKGAFALGGTYDYAKAPYVQPTGIHWLFDIEIDPTNSDHAIFTTGYGGHETFNLTDMDRDKPTIWHCMATGIEETVALELLSPPQGAYLISAVGDYGGFVHWDLDKPAPEGNFDNPHFGNTDGVTCAELKPEVVVRVGMGSHQRGGGNIGYSLDGGRTWQPAGLPQPNSSHGSIAVSADGGAWIWTPERSTPYVTFDRGKTWTECQGLASGTRVIADRVNPDTFYALDLFGGQLSTSTDEGRTFTPWTLTLPNGLPQQGRRGDSRGGQDRIYATPGRQGDLWIAAFDGLYHSADAGKTFFALPPVEEIHAFGFGKAAPGAPYPALYLVGIADGTRGIFRSDDTGRTWVRINDDQHQWGLILHVAGDPKQYGRVYVGTHGRGTMYGDPVAAKN
jgi:photosystem II stability/assembly factor-like uncharacterized protein